ncbi:unnamed protein product [Owenia fusiformis]|uniref:Sodium-dependent glucose transporter 1 n=1 Tax=Owenia fusiformis TaxID=6347 RepID=A0A8S4P352_OWEFU|nr:unnamed protein product [Owenia fusiformis]
MSVTGKYSLRSDDAYLRKADLPPKYEEIDVEKNPAVNAVSANVEGNGLPSKEKELEADADDDFVETRKTFAYRLGKQILLFFIWISIGLFLEITGPALQDLMVRVDSNYEEISRGLTGKSVGVFVGAIMGGYLCDRFSRHVDLLMSMALFVAAVATVFVPWCNKLGLLAVMFLLQGTAEGVINAGGNAMTLNLWGERAAAPMHSLHFGFGIGAIVAPQLARPFLMEDKNANTGTSGELNCSAINNPITDNVVVTTAMMNASQGGGRSWDDSQIQWPYLGIAVYVAILSVAVLGLYLKGPPKGFRMRTPKANDVTTDIKDIVNPATCNQGDMGIGLVFFILLFIYFIQGSGGERAYGKFLFSYAKDEIKMNNAQATTLNSVFWACFTAGRALSILIASLIPVQIFMGLDNILVLAVAIVLAIWSNVCPYTILWVFSGLLGAAYAPIFPNGFAWANRYMDMTATAACVMMMGGACGGFIYQYMTGALVQQNFQNLMYVEVGHGICLMVVFILMCILGRYRGEKFDRIKEQLEAEENDGFEMSKVEKS